MSIQIHTDKPVSNKVGVKVTPGNQVYENSAPFDAMLNVMGEDNLLHKMKNDSSDWSLEPEQEIEVQQPKAEALPTEETKTAPPVVDAKEVAAPVEKSQPLTIESKSTVLPKEIKEGLQQNDLKPKHELLRNDLVALPVDNVQELVDLIVEESATDHPQLMAEVVERLAPVLPSVVELAEKVSDEPQMYVAYTPEDAKRIIEDEIVQLAAPLEPIVRELYPLAAKETEVPLQRRSVESNIRERPQFVQELSVKSEDKPSPLLRKSALPQKSAESIVEPKFEPFGLNGDDLEKELSKQIKRGEQSLIKSFSRFGNEAVSLPEPAPEAKGPDNSAARISNSIVTPVVTADSSGTSTGREGAQNDQLKAIE
jgi:hypothetical protein